jgi:hypothetical protein
MNKRITDAFRPEPDGLEVYRGRQLRSSHRVASSLPLTRSLVPKTCSWASRWRSGWMRSPTVVACVMSTRSERSQLWQGIRLSVFLFLVVPGALAKVPGSSIT